MEQKQTKSSCIPKDFYIQFALPGEDWRKLRAWLDDHDAVRVYTAKPEEVYLLNETQTFIWRRQAKEESATP
jgi:hypothetical protein